MVFSLQGICLNDTMLLEKSRNVLFVKKMFFFTLNHIFTYCECFKRNREQLLKKTYKL